MADKIEFKMRTYLAGLTTSADDFYLMVAVQGADFPYGVITKVSPGKDYYHGGASHSVSRMQCSCYAENYFDAKTLASDVIAAMEDWINNDSSVESVFLEGEVDMLNEDVHHIAVDFMVFHKF